MLHFEPDFSNRVEYFWNQNTFMASIDLVELIKYKTCQKLVSKAVKSWKNGKKTKIFSKAANSKFHNFCLGTLKITKMEIP